MSSMRTPKSLEVEEVLAIQQEPRTKFKNKIVPAVATIAGTATAVPPHVLSREIVKNRIGDVFSLDGARLDAIREVIDNSAIDQRYSVFPPEYTIEPRPLAQINAEYQEKSVELGLQVAERALAQAGMTPTDVDLLVTVSCTGVMIPSLDAHHRNDHGISPGCAAASHHGTWLRCGRRGTRAHLGISVRVSGSHGAIDRGRTSHAHVSAQGFSQANLISAVLFGDGAAGVVVTGREAPGPRILASECFLFPNSLAAMGFDLRDSGFHIVLSKDVPELIRERVKDLAEGFLARQGLRRDDISAFLLHPGGQKLLSFMQEELGLDRSDTEISWDILRRYGNLSSASVLFILNEWLVQKEMPSGSYGLLMAFGPGFTAEMLLLQWP